MAMCTSRENATIGGVRMDEFLIRALAAGIGLSLVTGPFGCVVVWRRMAYFGDSLAHGALLGVVLGVALEVDPSLGIALFSILMALFMVWAQSQRRLGSDTWLGILAHSALALGLVLISVLKTGRINLTAWLLGDILALDWGDVAVIWAGAPLILFALSRVWDSVVAASLDPDLALVDGHSFIRSRLIPMVLMALVVAGAMKLVGVLLITALLIIPAAAARPFARSPEGMAMGAILAGSLAVMGGLALSWRLDSPTGPSIVVAALLLFLVSRGGRS